MYTDQLLNRLLSLLHGDKASLKRLVLSSINSNPQQPAQWHLEKVIWNLERDRR